MKQISLALIGMILCATPAFADPDFDAKALSAIQTSVTTVQPASPAKIKVVGWVDHKSNVYKLGESVSLFVKANKDAYFTVIDIGPGGNATVLYPNAYEASAKVPANTTLQIPGKNAAAAVVASAPAGTELIRIVASPEPLTPIAIGHLTGNGPFPGVTGGANTVTRDLSVVAAQPYAVTFYDKTIRTVADTAAAPPPPPPPAAAPAAPAPALLIATDRSSYKLGEKVNLSVVAAQECYLWVLDIDGSGKQHILFPNSVVHDNKIDAGKTAVISGSGSPVSVIASPPAGQETVIALCSNNPQPKEIGRVDFSETFPPFDENSPLGRDLALVATQPTTPPAMVTTLSSFNWAQVAITTTN